MSIFDSNIEESVIDTQYKMLCNFLYRYSPKTDYYVALKKEDKVKFKKLNGEHGFQKANTIVQPTARCSFDIEYSFFDIKFINNMWRIIPRDNTKPIRLTIMDHNFDPGIFDNLKLPWFIQFEDKITILINCTPTIQLQEDDRYNVIYNRIP